MKKRKFKLFFKYHIRLDVDKFESLKGKLPTDVDILRRLLIWKETSTQDPYVIQLNDEEFSLFLKEIHKKIGPAKYHPINIILIDGTDIEIIKIEIK